MADSREIVLAGTSYKITVPLTLEQMIEANVGMALPTDADPKVEAKIAYQRAINVIVAAMKPENPTVTDEWLRKLRGSSIKEFNRAATICYEESGLISKKEGVTGEGEAETSSTGTSSSEESAQP